MSPSFVPADDAEQWLLPWLKLICLLALLALAAPFLAGRIYLADDLGAFHLPMRAFYSDQLHKHESFDWLPSLFNGFYLTGEGQVGSYHPVHLLLYRWLPLRFAFDLELLLSYPLLLVGMYYFLCNHVQRRDAALFGSLIFTFSGFNLLHFVHPNAIAVVAHIPWLLLAIDELLKPSQRSSHLWAWATLALLTGSQLLVGYPQYVWFSLLLEGGYVAWRLAQGGIVQPPQVAGRIVLALLVGLLLGATQVVPTIDALFNSTRQVADADFINSGSLHPLNLVQLLAPYLFTTRVVGQNTHELGLYIGAVPVLLCLWLLAHRGLWNTLRPTISMALTLAALSLFLAFGSYGPLYRLQTMLPLVDKFRFPCRAIVLFQLAIAVLAAAAFVVLSRQNRRLGSGSSQQIGAQWGAWAISLLLAAAGPLFWRGHTASPVLIWCGPLLVFLAALALTAAERGYRTGLVALVVLTAGDLSIYGLSQSVWPAAATMPELLASQHRPAGRGRVVAETAADRAAGLHVGNQLLLTGAKRADGYVGLEPRKLLDYRRPAAMRLAGVRWQTAEGADRAWTPVARPLNRVRLLSQSVRECQPDLAGLDLDHSALVDRPLNLVGGKAGHAKIISDHAGSLDVMTSTPTRQLLVVAESYHSGWRAMVDGRSEPVVRVNHDFMGCVVEPGRHCVSLRFQPASLLIGRALSGLGLGLLVCLVMTSYRQTHRNRSSRD